MQAFFCSENVKTVKCSQLSHNLRAQTIDIKEGRGAEDMSPKVKEK